MIAPSRHWISKDARLVKRTGEAGSSVSVRADTRLFVRQRGNNRAGPHVHGQAHDRRFDPHVVIHVPGGEKLKKLDAYIFPQREERRSRSRRSAPFSPQPEHLLSCFHSKRRHLLPAGSPCRAPPPSGRPLVHDVPPACAPLLLPAVRPSTPSCLLPQVDGPLLLPAGRPSTARGDAPCAPMPTTSNSGKQERAAYFVDRACPVIPMTAAVKK
jgi:hypothetical protein